MKYPIINGRQSIFPTTKTYLSYELACHFGLRWPSASFSFVNYDFKPDKSLYDWHFTYRGCDYWFHSDPGCATLYRKCLLTCDCSFLCAERSKHKLCDNHFYSLYHKYYG